MSIWVLSDLEHRTQINYQIAETIGPNFEKKLKMESIEIENISFK